MSEIRLTESELKDMIREAVASVINEELENGDFSADFDSVYGQICEMNRSIYGLYEQYVGELDDSQGSALEEMYNASLNLVHQAKLLGQRIGLVGDSI